MSAEYKVTKGIYTRKYQAKNIWEVGGACVEKQRKFGKVHFHLAKIAFWQGTLPCLAKWLSLC